MEGSEWVPLGVRMADEGGITNERPNALRIFAGVLESDVGKGLDGVTHRAEDGLVSRVCRIFDPAPGGGGHQPADRVIDGMDRFREFSNDARPTCRTTWVRHVARYPIATRFQQSSNAREEPGGGQVSSNPRPSRRGTRTERSPGAHLAMVLVKAEPHRRSTDRSANVLSAPRHGSHPVSSACRASRRQRAPFRTVNMWFRIGQFGGRSEDGGASLPRKHAGSP